MPTQTERACSLGKSAARTDPATDLGLPIWAQVDRAVEHCRTSERQQGGQTDQQQLCRASGSSSDYVYCTRYQLKKRQRSLPTEILQMIAAQGDSQLRKSFHLASRVFSFLHPLPIYQAIESFVFWLLDSIEGDIAVAVHNYVLQEKGINAQGIQSIAHNPNTILYRIQKQTFVSYKTEDGECCMERSSDKDEFNTMVKDGLRMVYARGKQYFVTVIAPRGFEHVVKEKFKELAVPVFCGTHVTIDPSRDTYTAEPPLGVGPAPAAVLSINCWVEMGTGGSQLPQGIPSVRGGAAAQLPLLDVLQIKRFLVIHPCVIRRSA